MTFRMIFLAAIFCCFSVEGVALNNATNDTASRITNATVWAGGCTGTLIAPDLVVSAGHCDAFDRPDYSPPPAYSVECAADTEVSGRWYALTGQPDIRVGNDLSDLTAPDVFTTRAVEYSLPGCADIIVLRLEDPVPTALAEPVKVLTEVGEGPGATPASGLFEGTTFIAAGWGLANGVSTTIRQTAEMTMVSSNNSFIWTTGPNGVNSTAAGDSGSPLYWDAPSGRRYLVGVLQGSSRDRYTPTFRNSYRLSSIDTPDVGAFFERIAPDAVTCDTFDDRPSGTVPLYRYYEGNERQDNFTTADPAWIGCAETRREPGYKMSQLEGYLFSPDVPQPRGTVRLYSWWSGDRGDNVITSFPTWIYYEGGPATREPGYSLVRFEGYAFDPALPQPDGTRALYAWLSRGRGEYWVTTKHAEIGATGGGLSPDYERPTLMGYVLAPVVER